MEELNVNDKIDLLFELQKQVDLINSKMDIILDEISLQKKHRREMDDLKDDLIIVGKDLYQTAVIELEEVHDSLKTGDILYLFKKLLRNINNITKTFEQLESLKDFVNDISPLFRESFIDLMNKLNELDRKGYFNFTKELLNIIDRIVISFSTEDIKNLADNIVTILNTVKELTQPDILQSVNNAVEVYKKLNIQIDEDVSLFKLLKELNQPATRKGLIFALIFLKNLSSSNKNNILIKN